MQMFILDKDMRQNAKYYSDQHFKLILETAQMLCTVVNESVGEQVAPYKSTHKKHPWVIWATKSLSNWRYMRDFNQVLNDEKKFRFGTDHKSALIVRDLPEPDIEDIGLTPMPLAMESEYKWFDKVVKSYRRYYACCKFYFKSRPAKWTNRPVPYFMRGAMNNGY